MIFVAPYAFLFDNGSIGIIQPFYLSRKMPLIALQKVSFHLVKGRVLRAERRSFDKMFV